MSNLIVDSFSELPQKRLKTNPIIRFEIHLHNSNSTESTIVEFSDEKCETISHHSEYIKTLIEQYSDVKSCEHNIIYLIEDKPIEAAAFLTILSEPMNFELNWNYYNANLSSKWIVPKYITKYSSLINSFFKSYEISESNLMVTIHSFDISETIYYYYKSEKYICLNDQFDQGDEIDYFYQNEEDDWCYVNTTGYIFIQHKLAIDYENLSQLSGSWYTKDNEICYSFSFQKCAPKVINFNDHLKFCEIIELILTHNCYHNLYISSIDDLYLYLNTHKDFVNENNLNHLFQTKQELIKCLTIFSK